MKRITSSAHRVLVAEATGRNRSPEWLAGLVAAEKAVEAELRREAAARGITVTALRREVRIARRMVNRSDR